MVLNEIKTTWPPPKHKIVYLELSQLLDGILRLFMLLIRILGQGAHIGSNKNLNDMAVIQPRPTLIIYQYAKCGDDRTSFNAIFDVWDV